MGKLLEALGRKRLKEKTLLVREDAILKLKKKPRKTIFGILEKDHKTTFQKLNQFYEVLRKLRYEGKLTLGKNIAEAIELVGYFKRELDGHMCEEEKILFPFLKTHIPRLEPMIYLILSEHEDFRNSLKSLKASLSEFKRHKSVKPGTIDKICEQGTYLICLLRSHMWVESHSLYRAADKELRLSEKRKLIRLIEG
jgi:hemerythrin-like domain-containing protein